MKYQNLFLVAFLISLACLTNTNGRTKPRQKKPQQSMARKAPYKKTNKVELNLSYDFSVPGKTPKIRLVIVLPRTIPRRQRIFSIKFSPEPSRIFSKNGNDYAEFIFIEPEKQFNVEINIKVKLFRYDLSIARKRSKGNPAKDPNLNSFLKQETYIEKDHPTIQQIAKRIKGKTEENLVKNIHDYVVKNMDYHKDNKSMGALYAVQNKKGQCSEYAELFVAICRAKNIPARVISGYTTESSLDPKHAWAEVYLRRYGWVPFDPTWADIEYQSSQQFLYLKSAYIYLSHIRNDEVLNNNWYGAWWQWGDKIKVEDSTEFK